MKTKNLITTFAIATIVLIAGCSKDKDSPAPSTGGGGGYVNPTVIPLQTQVQATVDLQSAGGFAILAGSKISNVSTSTVTGNVGLSPAVGSNITGFGANEVVGIIYTVDASGPVNSVPDPVTLTAAKADLTTAYNDAAARTSVDMVPLSGNIGGLTLTPGLYKSSGSLEISTGNLTFDAKGNSSAVFIIQIASTLNVGTNKKVYLKGGALAENIFWQVGASANLGVLSIFKGNILADQSIAVNSGTAIEGRLLALVEAVLLEKITLTKK